MLPVLNLGGLALQTRGLVLLIGFWLALWVAERFAKRRDLDGDVIWNFGLLSLAAGFVGARLAYAAQNLAAYSREPQALLSLSIQSMAWPEGVLIGLLVGLIYLRHERVVLADAADVLAPAVAVLWALAGLGALFSGSAYGRPTTMPWGIVLWNQYRHPVQLYEVLAGGIVATALAVLWPRAPYRGWIALVGAALLGAARLIVEGFRGDPAVVAGGLRVAQLWALGLTLLALWALYRRSKAALRAQRPNGWDDRWTDEEPELAPGGVSGERLALADGGADVHVEVGDGAAGPRMDGQ
ncbi:MAG: prolipoprotein diacylglyceryl transferase [Ardenticatenaceae bacterium]|nr:prolipoprotein diacylglyceryl transferase [Ardenticatenaceae bacterium]HBY95206.1 hypothetical protein [Chloroflexota bacterium]